VKLLRRARRRLKLLAGKAGLAREDLARMLAGHVSVEGTKAAVKRAAQDRMKLQGGHGRRG
jgi:hypothetical protein